jgi:hypothetical protein
MIGVVRDRCVEGVGGGHAGAGCDRGSGNGPRNYEGWNRGSGPPPVSSTVSAAVRRSHQSAGGEPHRARGFPGGRCRRMRDSDAAHRFRARSGPRRAGSARALDGWTSGSRLSARRTRKPERRRPRSSRIRADAPRPMWCALPDSPGAGAPRGPDRAAAPSTARRDLRHDRARRRGLPGPGVRGRTLAGRSPGQAGPASRRPRRSDRYPDLSSSVSVLRLTRPNCVWELTSGVRRGTRRPNG